MHDTFSVKTHTFSPVGKSWYNHTSFASRIFAPKLQVLGNSKLSNKPSRAKKEYTCRSHYCDFTNRDFDAASGRPSCGGNKQSRECRSASGAIVVDAGSTWRKIDPHQDRGMKDERVREKFSYRRPGYTQRTDHVKLVSSQRAK